MTEHTVSGPLRPLIVLGPAGAACEGDDCLPDGALFPSNQAGDQ